MIAFGFFLLICGLFIHYKIHEMEGFFWDNEDVWKPVAWVVTIAGFVIVFIIFVNWLEEEHNIHLDRIWYDDKVTPTRWVYHVERDYAGSDYDEAILQALKLIKTK